MSEMGHNRCLVAMGLRAANSSACCACARWASRAVGPRLGERPSRTFLPVSYFRFPPVLEVIRRFRHAELWFDIRFPCCVCFSITRPSLLCFSIVRLNGVNARCALQMTWDLPVLEELDFRAPKNSVEWRLPSVRVLGPTCADLA
jgi:hypothetical protein